MLWNIAMTQSVQSCFYISSVHFVRHMVIEPWYYKMHVIIGFIYWSPTESPSSNDEGLNEVFLEESSLGHCEQCGRLTEAHHHRGPKRFCSTSCARRYSVSCSRKMVAFHARTGRGGRHSSANQLASDRKSSYNMPMVSSLLFVDLKTTHQARHSPPTLPHIHLPSTQCVSHSSPTNLSRPPSVCYPPHFTVKVPHHPTSVQSRN